MRDWNHDGKEDYWDDVFYLEQIERESHSLDDPDSLDLDDEDDYSGGYSYSGGGRSSSTSSYNSNNYRRTTPAHQSAGVPFIVRLIIACVVISVIGAFSELLGFIALIIWVIIEFNTR